MYSFMHSVDTANRPIKETNRYFKTHCGSACPFSRPPILQFLILNMCRFRSVVVAGCRSSDLAKTFHQSTVPTTTHQSPCTPSTIYLLSKKPSPISTPPSAMSSPIDVTSSVDFRSLHRPIRRLP
ncbi:hypothetical protein FRC03_003421 [Tulasnella sp. 419]|nr:hypothetical protein FRC03_003421 [Tulasnella sp. 419]